MLLAAAAALQKFTVFLTFYRCPCVSHSCYFKLKRFALSVMSQSFTYRYSTLKPILAGCLSELALVWVSVCVCVCSDTDSAEISIRIMSSHVKRIESNRSQSKVMAQLTHISHSQFRLSTHSNVHYASPE